MRDTWAYLLGRRAFEERHHRRYHFVASLVLRLALCAWAVVFILSEPNFKARLIRLALVGWVPGWLFTTELMALAHGLFSQVRHRALEDVEGQFYVFRGKPMRVGEWVPGERWLAVEDLERALERDIRVVSLKARHGDGCEERDGRLWLSAPACLDYLEGLQDAQALKVRHWVHGTVWLPSGQARRQGRDRWRR